MLPNDERVRLRWQAMNPGDEMYANLVTDAAERRARTIEMASDESERRSVRKVLCEHGSRLLVVA